MPLLCRPRQRYPMLSFEFGSTGSCNTSLTVLGPSSTVGQRRLVILSSESGSTLFCSSSCFTTISCPSSAANDSGVQLSTFFESASTLSFFSSSCFTIVSYSFFAAYDSGVRLSLSLKPGLTFSFSSSVTAASPVFDCLRKHRSTGWKVLQVRVETMLKESLYQVSIAI